MLDILLVVHLVLSFLLIFVILVQKTSADGLSGLSGGVVGNSVFAPQTAANILHKITIILATLFMINALILANLSSFNPKKEIINDKEEIPLAK